MDLGKVRGIKIHSGIPSPSFCGPQKCSKTLKFVVAGEHENATNPQVLIIYVTSSDIQSMPSHLFQHIYCSKSYPPYLVLLCHIVPYNLNSTLFRPEYVHIADIVSYIDFICHIESYHIPVSQQKTNRQESVQTLSASLAVLGHQSDHESSNLELSWSGASGHEYHGSLGKDMGIMLGTDLPSRKPSHIPPKGIRKIVDSKMPC